MTSWLACFRHLVCGDETKRDEQQNQQGSGVGSESEFPALYLSPPHYFSPLSDFPPHSTFPTPETGYKLIKIGNEEAQYRTS